MGGAPTSSTVRLQFPQFQGSQLSSNLVVVSSSFLPDPTSTSSGRNSTRSIPSLSIVCPLTSTHSASFHSLPEISFNFLAFFVVHCLSPPPALPPLDLQSLRSPVSSFGTAIFPSPFRDCPGDVSQPFSNTLTNRSSSRLTGSCVSSRSIAVFLPNTNINTRLQSSDTKQPIRRTIDCIASRRGATTSRRPNGQEMYFLPTI